MGGGSIVLAFDLHPHAPSAGLPVLNVEWLTEPQDSVMMPPAISN